MKLKYTLLLLLGGLGIFFTKSATAQLVSGNCFLQGHFLEIGMLNNASFGAPAAPAGYHPYPGGSDLGETYDLNHDGWTVGTPAFNGDYTYPGSPFEGWEIQVNGTYNEAFSTSTTYSGTGTLTGGMLSYSNTGGRAIGNWAGTASSGGLTIRQETRVDTESSWVVVTTYFHNTTAATIPGVYYLRSCDPDNDEAHGGGTYFSTTNTISYQNDVDHRVGVDAFGTLYNDHFGLCTKDYRAKSVIYTSWPISGGTDLASLWAGTYGLPSGAEYIPHNQLNGDYAMGLVYKVGDIAAGDSALISYAYVFNSMDGVDSAFPEPEFWVNGSFITPSGPAPAYSLDTFRACEHPGVSFLPVNIRKADDKCWTWSKWNWAPAAGLATTTGLNNTITLSGVPAGVTTYTITGTDSATGMNSGNTRVFYLTVVKCLSATNNTTTDEGTGLALVPPYIGICADDTLLLHAHGDSLDATYQWYGPMAGSSLGAAVVGDSQNIMLTHVPFSDSGTFTVIRTVAGGNDTATTLVVIKKLPVVTAVTNSPVCSGNSLVLTSTTDTIGETWQWTGPDDFSSSASDPVITPAITANSGTYKVITTLNGCSDSAFVTATVDSTPEVPTLGSNSAVCLGDTLKLTSYEHTAGVTYSWVGPDSFAATGSNPILPNTTMAANGFYTLTVTLGACTSSNAVSVQIINPTVTASVNTPVCSGLLDTIFLHAVSSDPTAVYSWTGPYSFSSGAQDPFRTPVVAEYSGVYHVTATVGVCPSYADVTVVVHQTPTTPWVKWLTYCQFYDAPPLQAGGDNIMWYGSSATDAVGTATPPVPQTAATGWQFYYVNQTVDGCTGAIDSIKVQVNPKPAVTVLEPAVTTCPRDSVVLTAVDSDPIAYYHWLPEMYVTDTAAPTTIVMPETNMFYSVVATNEYGCTDTATVSLTVHPAAVISLADSVTLFPGETYQMEPVTNCTTVTWSPAGGLTSPYIVNPVASPEISTRYFIRGENEWGCKAKDSIDVVVSADGILGIPNAFVPGSGPNGLFKIAQRGLISLHHFRIYDRWGVVVFEAKDVADGWDGTYKGAPQPMGVYIYDIEAVSATTGREFVKRGNLTLLR